MKFKSALLIIVLLTTAEGTIAQVAETIKVTSTLGDSLTIRLDCNTGIPLVQIASIDDNHPVIFTIRDFSPGFNDLLCKVSIIEGPVDLQNRAIANGHELNGRSCVYTYQDDLLDSVQLNVDSWENTCQFLPPR